MNVPMSMSTTDNHGSGVIVRARHRVKLVLLDVDGY
jgi:hypothetical protein